MRILRKAAPLLGLATLAALAPAHAQTTITGHYDGNTAGNGYNASNGVYVVPADSGGTPLATFNTNTYFGLTAFNSTVTVNGGQFNGNGSAGFYMFIGSANVTGGQFNNNGTEGIVFTNSLTGKVGGTVSGGVFSGDLVGVEAENNATVTVSGGTFSGASVGAVTSYTGSDVTVTGGQFTGNAADFYVGNSGPSAPSGTIDVFGSFTDPTTGKALGAGQTRSLMGSGSFIGTLANNASAQSYTYANFGGSIILHGNALAAAPEPNGATVAGLGCLILSGLTLCARRRKSVV